jgi:hypothetical protein
VSLQGVDGITFEAADAMFGARRCVAAETAQTAALECRDPTRACDSGVTSEDGTVRTKTPAERRGRSASGATLTGESQVGWHVTDAYGGIDV